MITVSYSLSFVFANTYASLSFSGKIRDLRIREKNIPFKIVLQDNGYAKLVATEDLDAESVSEYRFSIYAVDNGTRARKSERSRVYCEVVDVNEFAPIFKHPVYVIEAERGTIYKNLIQVNCSHFLTIFYI